MPSVQTHLLHMFLKCSAVSGLVAALCFCTQDLWSWIWAILQDSMRSVITHLLHTFKIHLFLGSWLLAPCFPCMQESISPSFHHLYLLECGLMNSWGAHVGTLLAVTPTVGLEPTTTRLRALRSAD